MLKVATWNVNSLKIRLQQVLDWLDAGQADILALQETKVTDELFPAEVFREKGWYLHYSGQKTYNGVAVISRYPIEDVCLDIPLLEDPQRRIMAATIKGIRLLNLYIPNGSLVGSEKYLYKLSWLEKMQSFIAQQLSLHSKLMVVGDFNIAPDNIDVHDPVAWAGSVLVSEAERAAFSAFCQLGLYDSFRILYPETQLYSWWDYRAAAFRRNNGLRIDHILLNQPLQAICSEVIIDKEARKHERPSDHAPVIAILHE